MLCAVITKPNLFLKHFVKVCERAVGSRSSPAATPRCARVPRLVCGPRECPLRRQERPRCSTTTTSAAAAAAAAAGSKRDFSSPSPRERCSLLPSKRCRTVTRLLPRLEAARRCVKVPKEVCFSVRRPKTVRTPTVMLWCSDSGRGRDDGEKEEEEEEEGRDDDDPAIKPRHTVVVAGGAREDHHHHHGLAAVGSVPPSTSVEVLDLSGRKSSCHRSPPSLPVALQGVAAVNFMGAPLLCGGYDVQDRVINRYGGKDRFFGGVPSISNWMLISYQALLPVQHQHYQVGGLPGEDGLQQDAFKVTWGGGDAE